MNWTGGALSRSRNANVKASLLVKQKNHFAKARVKLQHGQRVSPPEVQYFDFGEWKPERGVRDDRQSDRVNRNASSQRTLDQFHNVQGVVRKLKSLRPRQEERSKRKRSLIDDTEGYVLPSGIPIPPISPTVIGPRSHSGSSPVQAEPTEQDVMNPLQASISSTSDRLYPLAALDSVETKRRRLLQQSDWVGIERQKCLSKPIKMKFTDAKDRDLIGRRRPFNGSAVQNRWNVKYSRPTKIPLMTACDEGDESWKPDGMSIRIGSTASSKGPIVDEMLDCYHAPEVNRSAHRLRYSEYTNLGHEPQSQYRPREATTPSGLRKMSSEPFRSLFSPEEIEQSCVTQLVEASTIPEIDNLSFTEDHLQLPEDYKVLDPKPRFRLVFDQTPELHGQTSKFDHGNGPNVGDLSSTERNCQGNAVEQTAHNQEHDVPKDPLSGLGPTQNARPSTSPLSIATSRYMRELEDQNLGTDGPEVFSRSVADRPAHTKAQPALNTKAAEDERYTNLNEGSEGSEQHEEVQGKENVHPTEDEDEIWRCFISLDDVHGPQASEPTATHIAPRTANAPLQDQQIPAQPSIRSNPQIPPPHAPDDEQIWRDFIFSSPNANSNNNNNNNEWTLEEASPKPPSPKISHTSTTYDPTRPQPSMVAEAATSPVKQNRHLLLLDEMLDDSPPFLDAASHYAHAATSPPGSHRSTGDVSNMHPQQSFHPSSSSSSSSSILTATIPTTTHNKGPNREETTNTPSSSLLQAHTSPLSSSNELSRTPPPPPPPKRERERTEKVTFRKPTRYTGAENASSSSSEPVHCLRLGRRIGRSSAARRGQGKGTAKGKGKGKGKGRSLAEAVERAKKRQVGGRRHRKEGKSEEDEDEIVDDD